MSAGGIAAWSAVVAVALTWIAWWAWFSASRLDRLHARVDGAEATLDAELVRRGVALVRLRAAAGDVVPATPVPAAPRPALGTPERQAAENDVGRAVLADLAAVAAEPVTPGSDLAVAVEDLREACERVHLARLFYDDAVRDTRILRARRLTRLFRLAGHRALPGYFDIDDTVPPLVLPDEVRAAGAPRG